ncbi:MAG: hypothetical protein IPG64_14205 [Haliea sp.]|nr:hypothetical protein [Haliea sp.]
MLAKLLGSSAVACAALVFIVPVFAAEEVVLKARDFVVTTQDFENYLTEKGVTEKNRGETLSREGVVKKVFGGHLRDAGLEQRRVLATRRSTSWKLTGWCAATVNVS